MGYIEAGHFLAAAAKAGMTAEEYAEHLVAKHGGNITRAARSGNWDRKTIYRNLPANHPKRRPKKAER